MPISADELSPEIVARITADASEFSTGVKAAVEQATMEVNKLGGAAAGAGESIKGAMGAISDLAAISHKSFAEAAAFLVQSGAMNAQVADQAVAKLNQVSGAVDDVEKRTAKWNATLKTVLKSLLGLSAIQIARSIINFLKEAATLSQEFNFEQYKLEVGIRAAQRRMGEAAGTMADWVGFIKELRQQFSIFSTKDLTAATAKVVLLTRELGFNKEQMQLVTTASIALAEVSGKTVEDAARRLALFLDTGYSRGLAQLGVQISRVTVQQYALAHGITTSYNEMSRAQRATVALAAVMEQINPILKDAGRAAETFKGQLMSMRAAQQDAMIELGASITPLILAWERVKTLLLVKILPGLARGMIAGLKLLALDASLIVAIILGLYSFLVRIKSPIHAAFRAIFDPKGLHADLEAVRRDFFDSFNQMLTDLNKQMFAPGSLGDAIDELGSLADGFNATGDEADAGAKAIEEAFQRIAEALKDYNNDAADAWQDLLDKQRDTNKKLAREIEDIQIDLGRSLLDLFTKYNQDRAKLIQDATNDEISQQTEARDRVAERMAEYRLRELQATREFNLEMQQLNRRYLFDLEDAVRERDARGILNLQRKHNLEVTERTEKFDEERRQAAENLALDLAQLRADENRRRTERRRQLNQRLADLAAEYQINRQRKMLEYQRDLEDARLKNERERADNVIDFSRKMRDLGIFLNRKLLAIGQGIALEFKLNNQGALAIYNMLKAFYGPTGFIMKLYQGLQAGISAMQRSIGTSAPSIRPPTVRYTGGYAKGGAVVAKKKSTATFGEKGPELASFIPLDKLGDVFGGLSKGAQPAGRAAGSGGSKSQVDIVVKPDDRLFVEVEDHVLGSMADVILTLRKEKTKR